MGANCCTPPKHKTQMHETSTQFSTHRNATYSPSWSLRWDNGTQVEDVGDDSVGFAHGNILYGGREMKRHMDAEADGLSDGGSALDLAETPKWPNMPVHGGDVGKQKADEEDPSISGSSSSEGRYPKATDSFREEPSTSRAHHGNSFGFKPSNEDNSVISVCSNELSHGGSSDGWSMRMFSELVASSRWGRCSFDNESISSAQSKITVCSLSPKDPGTCVICSKLLRERCPWSRKIVSNGARSSSTIAVLVCGHLFHAECLENMTADVNKFDPLCPICVGCEKYEGRGRNKVSRSAVADLYSDGDFFAERQKCPGRERKNSIGSSSGFKSLGRPFLKRHFSIGSRSAKPSVLEIEQPRRKGFWGRYQDE